MLANINQETILKLVIIGSVSSPKEEVLYKRLRIQFNEQTHMHTSAIKITERQEGAW